MAQPLQNNNAPTTDAYSGDSSPSYLGGNGFAAGMQAAFNAVNTKRNDAAKQQWSSLSKAPSGSASSLGVKPGQAGADTFNRNTPLTGTYQPKPEETAYLKPGETVRDVTPNYSGQTGKNIFVGRDTTETRPGYSGVTFSDTYRGATKRGLDEDIAAKGLQAGDYKMKVGVDPTGERSQALASTALDQLRYNPTNMAAKAWEDSKTEYSTYNPAPNESLPSVEEAYNKIWGETDSIYSLNNAAKTPSSTTPDTTAQNERYNSPFGSNRTDSPSLPNGLFNTADINSIISMGDKSQLPPRRQQRSNYSFNPSIRLFDPL